MNTPQPVPSASNTGDDRTLAIIAPILGIFTSFIGALVIYLIKKSEGDSQALRSAREALNFQITLVLVYAVCGMTIFLILPLFVMWAAYIANIVLCIVHAVKASNGEEYRYPLTLRLIS